MDVGIWGMGRMGFNMVRRLVDSGEHRVVAGNRSEGKVDEAVEAGAEGAYSVEEFVEKLESPRVLWTMLPAGDVTDDMVEQLIELADEGDIIVDGANSYFRDSVSQGQGSPQWRSQMAGRRHQRRHLGLRRRLLHDGRRGQSDAFEHVEPAIKTLAPENGYAYMGDAGAGHFVKMVHNGIEYGMLQAYGEGFEILEKSSYDLDHRAIASLWNQGSVIRSWLLELAESAFENDAKLESIEAYVDDSGEGRWTVMEAIHESVPAATIAGSLFARFASRDEDSFAMKTIAALRSEFGGHAVKESSPADQE